MWMERKRHHRRGEHPGVPLLASITHGTLRPTVAPKSSAVAQNPATASLVTTTIRLGESSPGPGVPLQHRGDGLDVHACQVHRRRAGDIRIIGCRPFTCDPGTPARVVYSAGSKAGQEA